MYGPLVGSLAEVLQPQYLTPLAIGTLAGLLGGALPGVTITMTIIIVLPFTFGLDPLAGLAAMVGVYVGGESGGLVTATLLGIPGTPSAVATTFDGFPMARRGEPGRAVWLGTWASLVSGVLGAVFLIAATVPLARFALQFGPWEYFALFIFALSMVAGLTEQSLLKGFLSGALGLQEALGRARGEGFSVSELKDFTRQRGYIRDADRPGEVTLREVLLREWEIVQTVKEGVGDCHPLVANPRSVNPTLDDEQRNALDALLCSTNTVLLFRGAAGTGKSFVLREVVEQAQQAGRCVVVLAPQRQQVVNLEKAEFPSPTTVASFLLNGELAERAVVVVDEAVDLLELLPKALQLLRGVLGLPGARHGLLARFLDAVHRHGHLVHLLERIKRGGAHRCRTTDGDDRGRIRPRVGKSRYRVGRPRT